MRRVHKWVRPTLSIRTFTYDDVWKDVNGNVTGYRAHGVTRTEFAHKPNSLFIFKRNLFCNRVTIFKLFKSFIEVVT
ncbi:980_t:CDS:2 [Ambispora leptoticha]|uniref:980_t:CDS:1 n=1 Tax=Ambispora leptoticha TaxID=144679 RepID=A0A9N9C142_9GLOM|nr:980_t:CDS:2 [Ambispora leptoticha]